MARAPDSVSVADRSDVNKIKTVFSGITDFTISSDLLKTSADVKCGDMYFVKDSPALSCFADWCSDGVCVQRKGEVKDYYCLAGVRMAGKVVKSGVLGEQGCPQAIWAGMEGWNYPWVSGATTGLGEGVVAVCNDGSSSAAKGSVDIEDLPGDKEQNYKVTLSKTDIGGLVNGCEGKYGGLKGFGLLMYFNENCDPSDELHVLGRGGVDLGNLDRTLNYKGMFRKLSYKSSERAAKLKKELFFTADEIKKGVRLQIDVDSVYDIDEDKDMNVYNSLME